MIESLRSSLPQLRLLDDSESLTEYGRDWTRFTEPAPSAVALPASIEELSELVRYASRQRIALVPSGGRTGLSGGAVAAAEPREDFMTLLGLYAVVTAAGDLGHDAP